jgi:hypothetical protein
MMADPPVSGSFTHLLLEGLAHYRRGEMREAMLAWEAAYHTDEGNVQAREFLNTALQRLRAEQQITPRAQPWLDEPAPERGRAQVQELRAPREAQPAPQQTGGKVLQFTPPLDPTPAADTPLLPASPSVADLLAPQVALQEARREVAELEERRASVSPALLLREARERLARRDYGGALEMTAQILAADPSHPEACFIEAECETGLTELYESVLGDRARHPRLLVSPEKLLALHLDAATGYLLSQIDGRITFDDLFAVSPFNRLETARILARLVREGIIAAV